MSPPWVTYLAPLQGAYCQLGNLSLEALGRLFLLYSSPAGPSNKLVSGAMPTSFAWRSKA